jgi:rod shape-determining protein MreD
MTVRIRLLLLFILSIILQAAFFPDHLADPFKPDLLIIFVVYMGFRGSIRWGGIGSFMLGLVQDSLSGLYFGLSGFSFLLIFIILKAVSHRLYTDSRWLMVIGVFLASIMNGMLDILLLAVFSVADGIYTTILSNILPHSIMNAILAYMFFSFVPLGKREEMA